MNLMRDLQGMLEQGLSGLGGTGGGSGLSGLGNVIFGGGAAQGRSQQAGGAAGALSGLAGGMLGPAALGGLLGALFGGKGMVRSGLSGALLTGGATALWNMYTQRMRQKPSGTGGALSFAAAPQPVSARDMAERLVRAMVFAARCDGRIDAAEQNAITARVGELNIGPEAQSLVNQALAEPLDAQRVAAGVTEPEEALQLFAVSCAVIDLDNPAERAYLDALARALNIPDDVKTDLEAQIKSPA